MNLNKFDYNKTNDKIKFVKYWNWFQDCSIGMVNLLNIYTIGKVAIDNLPKEYFDKKQMVYDLLEIIKIVQ